MEYAAVCKFYGVTLSDLRAMSWAEYQAFLAYQQKYSKRTTNG